MFAYMQKCPFENCLHFEKLKWNESSYLFRFQEQETDKSERSSSPAFESDEDSTAPVQEKPQTSLNVKKRTSIVGIVMQTSAPLHVFATNSSNPLNGDISPARRSSKDGPNREQPVYNYKQI